MVYMVAEESLVLFSSPSFNLPRYMRTAPSAIATSQEFRLACRHGQQTGHSAGSCSGFVQANLVILPKR